MSDKSIGILNPGEELQINQTLASPSGQYFLIMQADHNLVVYAKGQGGTAPKALWATHTNDKGAVVARMQGDGNFVLYTAAGAPVWASNTDGHGNSFVRMQDDGNLVIYQAIWATDTKQH